MRDESTKSEPEPSPAARHAEYPQVSGTRVHRTALSIQSGTETRVLPQTGTAPPRRPARHLAGLGRRRLPATAVHRLRAPLDDRHSARRGTYRAIYRSDDAERTVTVVDIAHRWDAYRVNR